MNTQDRNPVRDYERDVERAIERCPRCVRMPADKREEHKQHVLRQILATQGRIPPVLPESVWQEGRAHT